MSTKYQIGLPAQTKRPKKSYLLENLAILVFVAILLAGIYWFVVKNANGAAVVKNNDAPRVTQVKLSNKSTKIDEPDFNLELPGSWKETDRNVGINSRNIMWTNITRGGVGRWVKIYIDTIPTDFALNFVMPVSSTGSQLADGQMSDNCVTFTPGADKDTSHDRAKVSAATLPSSYLGVNFICDNSHVLRQLVGSSSKEGVNSVTAAGPKGSHKYFFAYNDDNYHPDYNLFSNILESFKAK